MSFIDFTGQVFGCWKILGRADDRLGGAGDIRVWWSVSCSCGNTFETTTRYIRRRLEAPVNCVKCRHIKNVNGFAIKGTERNPLAIERNVNGFAIKRKER